MPILMKVLLDKEVPVFSPGEVVEGKVAVQSDKDVAFKGIIARCRGKAHNRWYDPIIRHHRDSQEEYLDDSILVFPQDGIRPKKAVTVPAGGAEFPFKFVLPTEIPNSFEGAHGFVRYEIFVNGDLAQKDDIKTKKVFTVVGTHDLNTDHKAKQAEQSVTTEFSVGFLRRRSVVLQACWDKPGYVPGETIQVDLSVDNDSSHQVSKIKLSLNQVVHFFGDVPTYGKLTNSQPPQRAMKEHKAVATSIKEKVSMKKSGHSTWKGQLPVPSLPPSDLPHCEIINLEYRVLVSVKCSKNLDFNFPVRIGTEPTLADDSKPKDYQTSWRESVFGSVSTANEDGEKWCYGETDSVFTPMYKVFGFDDFVSQQQQTTQLND